MTERATLTRDEAAAYVGLSLKTFAAEVARGTIPPPLALACRRKLWSRAALDRWLAGPEAAPGDALARAIEAYTP